MGIEKVVEVEHEENGKDNSEEPEPMEVEDEPKKRPLIVAKAKTKPTTKSTARLDSIKPSEWFKKKWLEWQKDMKAWQQTCRDSKDPLKRAACLANAKAKAKAKPASNEDDAAVLDLDAKQNDDDKMEGDDANKETSKTKKDDPVEGLEDEIDEYQGIDIFGFDNVCDTGKGEPLFANFEFEDWALLTLRFELHLLVHAFNHDCDDPERHAISSEHLSFYYNKYFKKALDPKNYGVQTIDELIGLVKDTVISIGQTPKAVESQIAEEPHSNDVFLKLTEHFRRDRQRRIDAGDSAAALKFSTLNFPALNSMLGIGQPQGKSMQGWQGMSKCAGGKGVGKAAFDAPPAQSKASAAMSKSQAILAVAPMDPVPTAASSKASVGAWPVGPVPVGKITANSPAMSKAASVMSKSATAMPGAVAMSKQVAAKGLGKAQWGGDDWSQEWGKAAKGKGKAGAKAAAMQAAWWGSGW